MSTIYLFSYAYLLQFSQVTGLRSCHICLLNITMSSLNSNSLDSIEQLWIASGDTHHKCEVDASAANAWCCHVNLVQHLRGMFVAPWVFCATKNWGTGEALKPAWHHLGWQNEMQSCRSNLKINDFEVTVCGRFGIPYVFVCNSHYTGNTENENNMDNKIMFSKDICSSVYNKR